MIYWEHRKQSQEHAGTVAEDQPQTQTLVSLSYNEDDHSSSERDGIVSMYILCRLGMSGSYGHR